MLALAFLFFFVMYLLISAGLAWVAAKLARERGNKGWMWGLPVFVLMLGLIFWDWLPMEVTYRHMCANDAGFTQYRTLDEWKRENLGVAETLIPTQNTNSIRKGNRERYTLNQRFAWDIIHTDRWFHIRERDERIVDIKTNKIMARYIDFDTDIPPIGIGGDSLSAYKIWMMKKSCEVTGLKVSRKMFSEFKHLMKYQKEIK